MLHVISTSGVGEKVGGGMGGSKIFKNEKAWRLVWGELAPWKLVCADEDQPESGESAAKAGAECGAAGRKVFLFGSASSRGECRRLAGPGRAMMTAAAAVGLGRE